MGGDATNDATLIKTAGAGAEGWISTTAPLPQFLSGAKDFVTDFTKEFNAAPGPYSVYEYDSVGVAAQAIKDANSTDPAAIIKALHAIKNYPGLTGSITFDKQGDRTTAAFITVIVKNGAFTAGQTLNSAGQWVSAK